MEWLYRVNWESLLVPKTSLLEMFIRGTVMYLVLFLLLRVILKRESGSIGITDLLVVTLLADASQNALAGEYSSIIEGIMLVFTVIMWSHFLNWLGYRFPRIQQFIHPPPLLLVQNGQLIPRNMRKEFITEEELKSMLREEGVDDVAAVKKAYMEGDGTISVIK